MSKSVKWLSGDILFESVEASRKMYDFIKRDFDTCIEYVALDTKHFDVYSPRLANIILRIGPEILTVFNLILFDQKFSRFFEKHPELEKQIVKIQRDRENRKDRFIDYLMALPNSISKVSTLP